ncbi:MAG: hypothetical protein ACE5FZ_09100 [Nitrospiria bacterium]
MSDQLFVFLVSGALGAGLFTFGVLIWSGRTKTWFLQKSYPVIAPKAIVFALIPMGIVFLLTAIIVWLPDVETRGKTFVYVGMPIYFIGLILAILQPKWLLPKWYQWLLAKHGDNLHLLEEEARTMDKWEWQRRVSTQEGLESWVAEVRRKCDNWVYADLADALED